MVGRKLLLSRLGANGEQVSSDRQVGRAALAADALPVNEILFDDAVVWLRLVRHARTSTFFRGFAACCFLRLHRWGFRLAAVAWSGAERRFR